MENSGKIPPVIDPIGRAVFDYHFNSINQPIVVHSDDFEDDAMHPEYFFRSFRQMPLPEKKAMNLCRGTILDVGAGAGAHSVYLQKKGFAVTALEHSELCCQVLKSRGINRVVEGNIFSYSGSKFDTILLLMNGTGIAGTLHGLDILFHCLKNLLNPDGQILIDSSDLIYLYQEEDGSVNIDLNSEKYYGELIFQAEYREWKSEPFPWLYVDQDNLRNSAEKNKLFIDKIITGQHFDYLARIIHQN